MNEFSPKEKLEELKSNIGFGIKFWLEFHSNNEHENILGSGWAKLLETIDQTENNEKKSLKLAAEKCGYSYKYAWNIIQRIESRTGMAPVETSKGGRGGGGWVKLNEWGKYLLKTYRILLFELKEIERRLQKTLKID